MKRIAIVQSNYLPWKGYFDMMACVDEFVLFDEVQYTRRDWRNRNKIKSASGLQWLTVPVQVKGKYLQSISQTALDGEGWVKEHLTAVRHAYAKAPYFAGVFDWFSALLENAPKTTIAALNRFLIEAFCARLGVATPLRASSEYRLISGKTERLVEICRQAGADVYVSGPAAKGYLDVSLFEAAGIAVRWKSYAGYREYPQVHPPFEHGVSALDLLVHVEPDAPAYLRSAEPFEP